MVSSCNQIQRHNDVWTGMSCMMEYTIGAVDKFINEEIYTASHYGFLDAPRAHGCAQMSLLISSWNYRWVHTKKSQIFTEKSIYEKLKNSIFKYKFLWLVSCKLFFSVKHHYER